MDRGKKRDDKGVVRELPSFYRNEIGSYVRPRISKEILRQTARIIAEENDDKVDVMAYGLALHVLQFYFGSEWLNKHVTSEPINGFLSRSLGSEGGDGVVIHRVTQIAEFIINLQYKDGVDAPLSQMASSADIEPAYAELEVGKLLEGLNAIYKFIIPNAIRGESYDLLIGFPNGKQVCADTKCKLEVTKFSRESVRNTLDAARKRNLPKGRPGAIFLKVPQDWMKKQELAKETFNVCLKFLQETSRIIYIGVYTDLVDSGGGITKSVLSLREIARSAKPDFPGGNGNLLSYPNGSLSNPIGWRKLTSFF